jgi:cobalt-zinc-cadmium efflux system protein
VAERRLGVPPDHRGLIATGHLGTICAVTRGLNRFETISVALAVLILWSAWKLITRTADVLMEGAPVGLMVGDLERTIRETPGVADLHDLHAWTISDGFDVVTVHVVLDGSRHGTEVAQQVSERIKAAHSIAHVTVQPEPPSLRASIPVSALLTRNPR